MTFLDEAAKWATKNRPLHRKTPTRVRKQPTEYEEQCRVVTWFRAKHPKKWMHLQASGNGSYLAGDARLRAIQMAKLKKAGLVVGQADLFLAIPAHGFSGMFIEMKSLIGKPSKDQLDFLAAMTEAGYFCVTCKGADAAIETIESYLREV